MMLAFGFITDVSTSYVFKQNPDIIPVATTPGVLDHTSHWDSAWYQNIIQSGYHGSDSTPVFYPLYPALIRSGLLLTGGLADPLVISFFLNTVLLAASLYFLRRIADYYLPIKYAWWPAVLFLVSPAAIFLHMFYTEALFCALGFGAFYFAKRQSWLACAVLLGLAASTRLPAILFIGLCGLEYLRVHHWSVWSSFKDKQWLYFLLAPFGFIVYGLYLLAVRNDFLAMFHSYALWSYQQFNPNVIQTLYNGVRYLAQSATPNVPFDTIAVVNFLLPLVGLGLLLASSIYAYWKLHDIPLALFGIASLVLFSLNSNSVSVHRYLLPTLVLYVAVAHIASVKQAWRYVFAGIVYCSILLQAVLTLLFVNDFFAG